MNVYFVNTAMFTTLNIIYSVKMKNIVKRAAFIERFYEKRVDEYLKSRNISCAKSKMNVTNDFRQKFAKLI